MNTPFTLPLSARLRSALAGLCVAFMGWSPSASAACPGIFGGAECDGDPLNVEFPVCTVTGSPSQITCDLGQDGETSATESKFVSTSSIGFRAYGIAGDGEAFCCEYAVSTCSIAADVTLTVYGTSQVDDIALADIAAGLYMECSHSYVYAGDSGDTINGSDAGNFDELHGEGGDDAIHGRAGNDTCYGGDGEDYVYGDDGNDQLYEDAASDHLSGGAGVDTIYGDSGSGSDDTSKNYILGGDGADSLYGAQYGDIICGMADLDTIYGFAGSDSIYGGPTGGDTIDGGTGTDLCEEGFCEALSLTSCQTSF